MAVSEIIGHDANLQRFDLVVVMCLFRIQISNKTTHVFTTIFVYSKNLGNSQASENKISTSAFTRAKQNPIQPRGTNRNQPEIAKTSSKFEYRDSFEKIPLPIFALPN
jgi:hypothetical protein